MVFTVFLDWCGGTYVSQVNGKDLHAAVADWTTNVLPDLPIENLGTSGRRNIAEQLEKDTPSALKGCRNVWVLSALAQEELALLHFVMTA